MMVSAIPRSFNFLVLLFLNSIHGEIRTPNILGLNQTPQYQLGYVDMLSEGRGVEPLRFHALQFSGLIAKPLDSTLSD